MGNSSPLAMARAAFYLLLLFSALFSVVSAAGDDRICCNHDNGPQDDDIVDPDDDNDGLDFEREAWYLYIPSDVNIECHREILTQTENATPDLTGYAFEANGCHLTIASCNSITGNLGGNPWCFQSGNDDDFGFGRNDFVQPIGDTIAAGCGNSYTVTRQWNSGSTCAGNTIGSTQRISVVDTTPPELNVPDDITVECEPAINVVAQTNDERFGRATVTDLCNQPGTISEAASVGGNACAQIITRQFAASDGCATSNGQQIVTIVDTTPPVIEHPPPTFVDCNSALVNPTINAHDGCQGDFITAVQTDETIYPGACAGEFTVERVFTAADSCGNEATHTQLFVVVDNDPPVVAPVSSDVVSIGFCDSLVAPPLVPTATDACGPATVEIDGIAILDGDESGISTRVTTFTATDDCGNSISFEQVDLVLSSVTYLLDAQPQVLASPYSSFSAGLNFLVLAPCAARGELIVSFSPLEMDFTAGGGSFCQDGGEGVAVCDLEFFPQGGISFSFILNEELPARTTVTIDYKIQDESYTADNVLSANSQTLVRF